jgi:hypothetical protein
MKGPLLGTNRAIDREEAKVDKIIGVDLPGLLKRSRAAKTLTGDAESRSGMNSPLPAMTPGPPLVRFGEGVLAPATSATNPEAR